ncbi:PIG-L deacetylase family protein [Actinocrispum wychmicini]|uniref:LmbE family N-acetylglucosaminyl deacetylase n=1 Tax=Actinocrispum wychmicini TaxID=1213861 RepID=A0A4R2JSJ4_9PSEU|nr:PIG-L deacetylase family protein [Actinocrispum wychmicini]TCO61892.1 LmbE family N-acetylglucosaminyl deacetylase [Actinocrispum wychmicini]
MPNTPQSPSWLREDWQRAVCVVAHPDDLEFGAASAIAKWTAHGKEVSYLLATRGEAGIDGMRPDEAGPLRAEEERVGAREVGVDAVEFLDYRDGVVEYGLPLRRDIARVIRRDKPDVVVSYAYTERMAARLTNQADHRAVGLAALDAARDAGNRWVFPELLDEGLEPWSGVRFVCFAGSAQPSHGVDVTGFLDRGIASLSAHSAYLRGLDDAAVKPAEFLTEIASAHGSRLNVEHAVLFDVYELVPDSATARGENGQ